MMRTPAELAKLGFEKSRIVIVNECHDGLARCTRTREVGRRILPAAHAAGVRHLAMEALEKGFASEANASRKLPEAARGYLAQEDLRSLMSDALALGWTLVDYECEFALPPGKGQDYLQSLAFANFRDQDEARRIAEFLAPLPPDLKLLVWCGNSHQRKTPQAWDGGGEWIRLGQRLAERGLSPFVIDQSVTVEYTAGQSPRREDVTKLSADIRSCGGSGGFLREEDPSPEWRANLSADAYLLSLDNSMVE